jgi:hypothetical protein
MFRIANGIFIAEQRYGEASLPNMINILSGKSALFLDLPQIGDMFLPSRLVSCGTIISFLGSEI